MTTVRELLFGSAAGEVEAAEKLVKLGIPVSASQIRGFTGLHARANFNLTNPNQVGLPLRAFDWSLSIGGSSPMRGRVDIAHTIPAMGSTPVDVDLMIGPAAAVEMASRLSSGARDYHLTGTLHFETQLGDIAVAIDHQGALEDLR